MNSLHRTLLALDLLDRGSWIRITLCCFAVGLLCYGYSFFNPIFAQDGAGSIIQTNDAAWKLSLGRYMQVLNMEWRGYIAAPWLVGFLSLFWISGASYFIAKAFAIRSHGALYALSALLTTNLSFIATHVAFIHEIDAFALALLCASMSIFCFVRLGRLSVPASSLCIALCCGFYQPFLAAVVIMLLFVFALRVFDRGSFRELAWLMGCILVTLILGIVIYYGLHNLVLWLTDTTAASGYNSVPISSLLKQPTETLELYADIISESYYYLLLMVLMPQSYHLLPLSLAAMITGIALLYHAQIVARVKRIGPWRILLLVLLFTIMLPLAFDLTRILSRGISHDGTRCVGVFYYVFALIFVQYCARLSRADAEPLSILYTRRLFVVLIGLICFSNIIVANQAFLKRDLAFQNTQFTWGRILSEMERTPGYRMGETPIIFIGQIQSSEVIMTRPGFEQADYLLSVPLKTSIADTMSCFYNGYFEQVLAYPINIESLIIEADATYSAELRSMPSFPHLGYCRMIGGKLYVKLSEPSSQSESSL